jgi:hypothetical protein
VSPGEIALEVARGLVDLLLKLVPAPVARQMLDDAAVRRSNAIADLAEAAKFGRLGDSEPPSAP